MKLVFAFIKCWWHCLTKFHRYIWFRDEIRLFGIIPVWFKYVYIKCDTCNEEFYNDEK